MKPSRIPSGVDSLFHSRARGAGSKLSRADELYRLAETCRDAGRYGRMLELLEAYLRLKPDRPEAAAALALTGRYGEALSRAATLLASGSLSPEETFLLGNPWINVHDAALVRAALSRVRAAAAARPAARLKALHLFILRSRAGLPAGAPPFFRGRLSIMNAHCADALLETGKAAAAARLLRETVKNFPLDEYSCGKLAEALLALGRGTEAFPLLSAKARALRSPGFSAWRGQLLLLTGRYAEAAAALRRPPASLSPMAACWLGAAELRLGRTGAALRLLARAAADRRDLEAGVWHAEALRAAGRHAAAQAEVRRVLSLSHSHPWALLLGSLLSYEAGSLPRAGELFARFRKGRGAMLNPPPRFDAAWAGRALSRAGGCRRHERHFIAVAAGSPVPLV